MITDELSIDFNNPAADALGYEGVQGKLRCQRGEVELQFDQNDRAFRKIPVVVRQIPYRQVESVEYIDRWFRPKMLVFKTKSPQYLDGFPGGEVGKVSLNVCRQSRKDAARLASLLDYKQSEAYLEESNERLDEARTSLDENRAADAKAEDESNDQAAS
jgi:hypothetical protein